MQVKKAHKPRKPLSLRTTGDDNMHRFLPEQYYEGGCGFVHQHTAMLSAHVLTVASRHRKNFFQEDVAEPDTEPWFLLEISTRFVHKSGFFGSQASNWEAHIASNGEVFFPIRPTQDEPPRPVARISLAYYGSINWDRFGPSDKELVNRAIAAYLATLQKRA